MDDPRRSDRTRSLPTRDREMVATHAGSRGAWALANEAKREGSERRSEAAETAEGPRRLVR